MMFSMAEQIATTDRSGTVTTVPSPLRIARMVLTPPKWSSMRKAIATRAGPGLRNFSATSRMLWRMALGLPVDPEEKRIMPGSPLDRRPVMSVVG